MNKEEYIIINKSVLEKRIEELEDIEKNSTLKSAARIDTIRELKQIISQSTPLIPEIEKAFDEGYEIGMKSYGKNENKNHYISNLKLDI